MYSNDDLNSAVEAGIFSSETLNQFRDHIAQQKHSSLVDDEQFRLISGFNDIFVLIACTLLLVSISWIGIEMVGWSFGALLQTITAWLLAEYFTRIRHMALPSIMLLISFVGGMVVTLGSYFVGPSFQELTIEPNTIQILITFGGASIAACLHWMRFKVPITIAAGVATLCAGFISVMLYQFPDAKDWINLLIFITGLLVFLFAMYWDSTDRQRQTRRSDVAFWLHLLAAPLLIHPIFSFSNIYTSESAAPQAIAVALLYLFTALVSISIDRRALMVSALAYVLFAISAVLKQFGMVSLGFALTAFMIGSGLLILSVFWHRIRQWLLSYYPAKVRSWLPVAE